MSEHSSTRVQLSLTEICHTLGLERHFLIEIVEHGIVEPASRSDEDSPEQWLFDAHMLDTLQRACRLRRDLELDWSTAALVLGLVQEKERLRQENERLRRQLHRFIET